MYYQRISTPEWHVTMRAADVKGPLVPYPIQVHVHLSAAGLDENMYMISPQESHKLIGLLEDKFASRVLISQQDPYADDLMKLKRIKAADPLRQRCLRCRIGLPYLPCCGRLAWGKTVEPG